MPGPLPLLQLLSLQPHTARCVTRRLAVAHLWAGGGKHLHCWRREQRYKNPRGWKKEHAEAIKQLLVGKMQEQEGQETPEIQAETEEPLHEE